MKYPSYIALLPFLALASCGQSGPSKSTVQNLIQQTANKESDVLYKATSGLVGSQNVTVTVNSMSCNEQENNSYVCSVLEVVNGNPSSIDIQVAKLNGKWVLLNN